MRVLEYVAMGLCKSYSPALVEVTFNVDATSYNNEQNFLLILCGLQAHLKVGLAME